MGTKVQTPAQAAGVECLKKTGEMDESESCKECRYWSRCLSAIMGVLEAEGR